MSLLLTLKRFHSFSQYFTFLNFGKFCQLGLPAEIKVQTSNNYETCKDRCKLCHINQTGQTTTRNETCIKFINDAECRHWANIYDILWEFCCTRIISSQQKRKTVVETISVTILIVSIMRCIDLYLINLFTKSTKVERCTDIMSKLTLYCLSVTIEDLNF